MNQIIRIGIDMSKSVFELHGVDAAEQPALRKRLRRRDLERFFARQPPTVIGMEACGGAHYWGRTLVALGHEVRLLPAQYVKPYVKRNKNAWKLMTSGEAYDPHRARAVLAEGVAGTEAA